MDEHCLNRVADAGALRLGVDYDLNGHIQICILIDVCDANSVGMFDHWYSRSADYGFDECLAAAGDNQIESIIHFCQESHAFAIGLSNELDTVARQACLVPAFLECRGNCHIRMNRFRAAAQDHCVASFSAKDG